ncbi:FHA domain-containing protein [Coleofasciculus sp. G1-WW12-02]|uniref:FHA domain-containing protein n=1 Tax=Coleofasciculus sp. G1-WW12-02 TaxID=3068483 RepID=UPI004062E4CA
MKFEIKVNQGEQLDVSRLRLLVVGRNSDLCNIVIPDRSVSAIQCLISIRVPLAGTGERVFWLFDGDGTSPSTNGCLLNGKHLIKQGTTKHNCPLFNGDFIRVGGSIISFFVLTNEKKMDSQSTIPSG